MANCLQTGTGLSQGNKSHLWRCASLHTFFWSLNVLFGCWVLGWPLLCSHTSYPGALLHVSRPHLIVPGEWERSQEGWQKQTGVCFGNVTLSFVRFPCTFSSTTAPGSSSPLSVALFPFECSLFHVLRSPFSYAVVWIRSIPICYSREEEFWFLI